MPDIQEIIDDLESMQYDILFWKRKEKDENVKIKLSIYDKKLDSIIEKLQTLDYLPDKEMQR